LHKWAQELGTKTFGYYEGHLPILVTSDIEIIQEVFVKQFANFSARKMLSIQYSDDEAGLTIVQASKSRWKRMLNVLNPTFSTAKLKDVYSLLQILK